jgi:hypothetical protein
MDFQYVITGLYNVHQFCLKNEECMLKRPSVDCLQFLAQCITHAEIS